MENIVGKGGDAAARALADGERGAVVGDAERAAIARLWGRKLAQDTAGLSQAERHRNLEPDSAEFIAALAAGLGAKRLVEIGGSSGLSTIALAAAARRGGGRLTSIEMEPIRQAEARGALTALGLAEYVDLRLGDATKLLPGLGPFDFALIDCEKEDYVRFFDLLQLTPGAVVVADNILSHDLAEYVRHVRRSGASVTLPIGKGLEVTRVGQG